MLIAVATRQRAECLGRHVGAVIVREGRIVATGYNGTPRGFLRCNAEEQGCHRCAHRNDEPYLRGGAYDVCLCVHAEQNALLTAARFGQQTLGAGLTSTTQPCFGCLKEMLQAGIDEVIYLHAWRSARDSDPEQQSQYEILASRLPKGIRQLAMHDNRAEWARGGSPAPQGSDQHGMESQ